MIRALILSLLLIGCASRQPRTAQPDPLMQPGCILHRDQTPVTITCGESVHTVQLDEWPLMVIDNRERWGKPISEKFERTDREKRAMLAEHLPGVIDDAERTQIAIYCGQSALDAGLALKAIGCAGVKELNPLMQNPAGIIGVQLFGCLYARWDAKQTHAYNSSAEFIKGMNKAKAVVNIVSLGNVAGCM